MDDFPQVLTIVEASKYQRIPLSSMITLSPKKIFDRKWDSTCVFIAGTLITGCSSCLAYLTAGHFLETQHYQNTVTYSDKETID
jgi:hypothetical protein